MYDRSVVTRFYRGANYVNVDEQVVYKEHRLFIANITLVPLN